VFQRVSFGGYDTDAVDAFVQQTGEQNLAQQRELAALQARLKPAEPAVAPGLRSQIRQQVRSVFAGRSQEILELALQSVAPAHRAVVVTQIDPGLAARFLTDLAPEARATLLTDLSRVRMVPQAEALDILQGFLAFFGSPEEEHFEVGGAAWLREVVHEAGDAGRLLCQAVEDTGQPTLADDLRTQLLTLRHLIDWPSAKMQTLLKELDHSDVVLVMAQGPTGLMDAMLACISKRAAEEMREEVEIMGDVAPTGLEAATRSVLVAASAVNDRW